MLSNKMIVGKQITVLWHVDYIKIFHLSSKVVNQVIEMIKVNYDKEAQLTISHQ